MQTLLGFERDEFIAKAWLPRVPTVVRGFVDPDQPFLRELTVAQVLAWAAPPVTARVYVAEHDGMDGARSAMISPVTRLPALFARLRGDHKRFVVYLSELERVVQEAANLCALHDFGYGYRHNGSRFSLCLPGRATGLGLHADRTDSILVQLHGRRRWCVYQPSQLPVGYVREVMTGQEHRSVRVDQPPAEELELEAGDALYVPVGYGHDGVTPDDAPDFSFAMATAWQAVTPLYLLRSVTPIEGALAAEVEERLDDLLQVLPDPPPGHDPVRWSVDHVAPVLRTLEHAAFDPDALQRVLQGTR